MPSVAALDELEVLAERARVAKAAAAERPLTLQERMRRALTTHGQVRWPEGRWRGPERALDSS